MPHSSPQTDESRRIVVTGLTTLRPGAMEFENLGNYVILEPFFQTLRDEFHSTEIVTTLQLSDSFCSAFRIHSLKDQAYDRYTIPRVLRCLAYAPFRSRRTAGRTGPFGFLAGTDLTLDFSGDMLGAHVQNWRKLLIWGLTSWAASRGGSCLCLVASSPGPFDAPLQRAWIRFILRRYDLIAVREPESLSTLTALALPGVPCAWYPCPSVRFRPTGGWSLDRLLVAEPRLARSERPLAGLILCDLNMSEPPLYKWPRADREFQPYVSLIEHLVTQLEMRVCVMSHQNRVDADGRLAPGPDHRLIRRLLERLPPSCADRVFTLNGVYDAPSSRRIIGCFDLLISGRIHGAMQGLTQGLPTAIIEYGLPPKAHKHLGFATLAGMTEYVARAGDAAHLRAVADRVWRDRDRIRAAWKTEWPRVTGQSRELWRRVRQAWAAKRGGPS